MHSAGFTIVLKHRASLARVWGLRLPAKNCFTDFLWIFAYVVQF